MKMLKYQKSCFSIFIFLLLIINQLVGGDKSVDISKWYLKQLGGLLHVAPPLQLNYPNDDSISVVPVEKVFGDQLSELLKPLIAGNHDSLDAFPNGLPLKDIDSITQDLNSRFSSWYMPADKWELLRKPTDSTFQWGKLGFPLIWEKKPNPDGEINAIIGGWFEAVPEKQFEELIKHAKEWLTPENRNLADIHTKLKIGDKVEKDFAIRMLIHKNDKKCLPLMSEYLSDSELHNTCLLAFQKFGTKDDIPTLIKTFYLPIADIQNVVKTMCKIGGSEVDRELRDWLNDPDVPYNTRQKIELGIRFANYRPAIEILIPFLNDKKTSDTTENLLNSLGYFPKLEGSISQEVISNDNVIATITLPDSAFDAGWPVLMDIRIFNNSKDQIFLGSFYNPKLHYKRDFNEVPIIPLPKDPNSRYYESFFKKRNDSSQPLFSGRGSLMGILPGKYISQKINLSKIFDLSLASEYLLSSDIVYYRDRYRKDEEILKIETLLFTITE